MHRNTFIFIISKIALFSRLSKWDGGQREFITYDGGIFRERRKRWGGIGGRLSGRRRHFRLEVSPMIISLMPT